jgi:hypothetical protein
MTDETADARVAMLFTAGPAAITALERAMARRNILGLPLPDDEGLLNHWLAEWRAIREQQLIEQAAREWEFTWLDYHLADGTLVTGPAPELAVTYPELLDAKPKAKLPVTHISREELTYWHHAVPCPVPTLSAEFYAAMAPSPPIPEANRAKVPSTTQTDWKPTARAVVDALEKAFGKQRKYGHGEVAAAVRCCLKEHGFEVTVDNEKRVRSAYERLIATT